MSFLISNAMAAAPAATQMGAENGYSSILLLVGFVAIFYFLILRPQNKRVREQKALIAGLAKGDEVISSGGIIGKIEKVTDDFISLEIANGVVITLQKSAIVASLPKGTLKAL